MARTDGVTFQLEFDYDEAREAVAVALFGAYKKRSAQRASFLIPGTYASDEWGDLPASFKRHFYEEADAAFDALVKAACKTEA